MRAAWLFAALLASGMCGVTVWAADEPGKAAEPVKEATKVPDGWVDYMPTDKIFGVFLPKGGKRTERNDTVPVQGEKIRVNIIELESEGKGKFVARTLLIQVKMAPPPKPMVVKGKIIKPPPGPPAGLFPSPAAQQAMREAMRDAFLKEVNGKVADEKDVKFGEHKGKEYQITIDDKTCARVRVFVTGRLLHQFGIVGTKEQVEGRDADTFFESYRMPHEQERDKQKDKEKDKAKE
jgi:hypothetical protein